jgi:hypothetical protein
MASASAGGGRGGGRSATDVGRDRRRRRRTGPAGEAGRRAGGAASAAAWRSSDRWLADRCAVGSMAPESDVAAAWEGAAYALVRRAGRRAGQPVPAGDRAPRRGARAASAAMLGELCHAPLAWPSPGAGRAALDPDLATSVRTAVGWTVSREEVRRHAGHRSMARRRPQRHRGAPHHRPPHVAARRADRSMGAAARLRRRSARRCPRSPAVGTVLHADLHHFPGRVPIRALVGVEHDPSRTTSRAPRRRRGRHARRRPAGRSHASPGSSGGRAWCGRRRPPGRPGAGWALVDSTGALPLTTTAPSRRCLAVSGGRPVVVAGEHRAAGFAPLAVRAHDRTAALR